jgi:hypothetical protein
MQELKMRLALIALCFISSTSIASAQTPASDKSQESAQTQTPDKSQDSSAHSTGRTVTPETKGQLQPQGWTGPINTTTGGAPPESPQGQSPPGMQAAPEGSNKTVVEPSK